MEMKKKYRLMETRDLIVMLESVQTELRTRNIGRFR